MTSTPAVTPDTEGGTEVDAVVIGSGFAGLYALYKLRNELGLSVQGFENAGGVGGTWWWNRYPGARSDTEVTAYCYSFDRELFDTWFWTERYPRQAEILSYLNHVADRYDLRRSIRFDTQVASVGWDDDSCTWTVTTGTGQKWRARFLIEAVGLLSATKMPEFPGQGSFRGEIHHTARWPHEGVALAGKRVAVIGTGSSGVQVIGDIAAVVGHLTVFQRTAQYVVPSKHQPIDKGHLQWIKDNYEDYWRGVLGSVTAFGFTESQTSAEAVSPEEREATFRHQYESGGGFHYMFQAFNDVGVSLVANNAATDVIKTKIREIVRDPQTAAKLTPSELYARRPLCADYYYETYNRDNVTLVDVKADPIAEITPTGIRTESGAEYELDIIILATGFDAVSGNQLKIEQVGRGGVRLADEWADRPRAHVGMMAHGFPNMFMIFGPMGPFTNQPPAHEAQVDWIADVITLMGERGIASIEPTRESEDQWMAACDEIAAGTLFPKVNSWINGSNIEGKPVTVMFFMGGMGEYMKHLRTALDTGLAGFDLRRPVGV
jgi:cation diffusion facilitator CzcD-associated flavoprotein CzcO